MAGSRSMARSCAVASLALAFALAPPSPPAASAPSSTLWEAAIQAREPWTGDLDGMVKRRLVRFLVVHNRISYFLDGATQRGTSYEFGTQFEAFLNKKFGKGHLKIHVVFIPVPRDRIFEALVKGEGDVASANLTITPEREKVVAFSDPFATGIREIVVAGIAEPPLASADDLSGRTVHVRRSSSYFESLTALNERFRAAGRDEVNLVEADEVLEDSDLLEMVNAGLLPAVVVDEHKAQLWAQVFEDIRLYPKAAVRTGGEIACAFRQNSPRLQAVVNEFVKGHKKGTLLGNIVINRYLKNTRYVRNPLRNEEYRRFREAVQIFQKYAQQYGFDWLLVTAQAYQESRIDQSLRSPAGAIGVMQVLPSTAADPNVNIRDIEQIENNVHAGVKYLRFILDSYFQDEPLDAMNRALFAFASYNAGPARVAALRAKATQLGLDPNRWFGNVEVAAAHEIGRETVQYVSNIFKYYVAYRLVVEHEARKEAAKQAAGKR